MLLLALVVGAAGPACKKKEGASGGTAGAAGMAAPAPGAPRVANIKITNDGVLTLNERAISLEALKASLADAAAKPTSIVYERPNRDQEPTPEAAPLVHAVLTAILDSKIPTRMAQ